MLPTQNDFKVLTTKDIASLMSVSLPTAKKYYQDIKKEYQINKVLIHHLSKYFKVNVD